MKLTKIPKNTNRPMRSNAVGRKPGVVAHVVNMGKRSADPSKLMRHINRRLPDWARR
jgi:GH24 family phage-related lysozyme (muramidase)